MLVVLVVFYAGLLLFFISGPSMDDIDGLRKIAFWVLLSGIVATTTLIFLGLPLFSTGPADDAGVTARAGVTEDEEEVFLEESLGLSEQAAAQEAEEALDRAEAEAGPGSQGAPLCGQCGARLIEGSQFCHQCGTPVAHGDRPERRLTQRKTSRPKREGET